MDVFVTVANTGSRLTGDRFAYLLTQVDILLAGAGPDAPREDDALTRVAGPCASPLTAERQDAMWHIRVDPAQVLALQAALARARTAYGDVAITWTEGTTREIQAAPQQPQQPNTPPAPADPAEARALRRRGPRMAQPVAVLDVDLHNWGGEVELRGFRQQRTAADFGHLVAGALMAQYPGSRIGVRVTDAAGEPEPVADGAAA